MDKDKPVKTYDAGQPRQKGLRWTYVLLIVLITIAVTAGATYWFLSRYLFLNEFEPVQLKPKEERVLNTKLRAVGVQVKDSGSGEDKPLKPERYSESDARREIEFSERELNGMLTNNTDLAKKLAIDLSEDLISANLLIPLEDNFPVLGGKTLRVNAGLEIAYKDRQPSVMLKGVSVMGVPLPNAWLGNMKNVDLSQEFSADPGFWKSFAEGIEYIRVKDGRLLIKLKK